MAADSEDEIRSRAYLIWEAEGQPNGQHERHWRGAAEELARDAAVSAGSQPRRERRLPPHGQASAPARLT